MGTSSSSKGPGEGVSFDPPWLDDIPGPNYPTPEPEPEPELDQDPEIIHSSNNTSSDIELAPGLRFSQARRNLNIFINTGNEGSLRKSIGHYSRTGMGGAANVARRMRVSSQTAAGLFNFLSTVTSKGSKEIRDWVEELKNKGLKPKEIADEIVTLIGNTGGSLDEASIQNSMTLAFEDLLIKDSDIDLLNLNQEHIWDLIVSFLGYEIFNRVYLDIGQKFENSGLTGQMIESRKDEMREYIMADLSACIDDIRQNDTMMSDLQLKVLFTNVLQRTFNIYEGVLQ